MTSAPLLNRHHPCIAKSHRFESTNFCIHYDWHQAITWTNVDWSSFKSSHIPVRAISQEMPQPSITKIRLKITYLKFHSIFPGANELILLFAIPVTKKVKNMQLLFLMLFVVCRFIPENVLKHVIYSNFNETELFWNQLFSDITK